MANNVLIESPNKKNKRILILITFLLGVLLIVASYAWLSASLNVKVKTFNMIVSTDNGLFISLDGIEFGESVEISMNSLITDMAEKYPTNTNQWAIGGLWPVSTVGIKNPAQDKFEIFRGEMSRIRPKEGNRRFLNTAIMEEEEPSAWNTYIAFDIFLKNVSGSPNSDNLYLDEGTAIDFADGVDDETKDSMTNIMNSMRFGFLKIGSTSLKSDVNTIQNIGCNNNCSAIIYEPNSTSHSNASFEKALELNMILEDGKYTPTYATIASGIHLDHTNGQEGTNIPLDIDHFKLQETTTNFEAPIFQIPNGITKLRAYVWIEGQDIDSLETYSDGAPIAITINFVKDLAGYN